MVISDQCQRVRADGIANDSINVERALCLFQGLCMPSTSTSLFSLTLHNPQKGYEHGRNTPQSRPWKVIESYFSSRPFLFDESVWRIYPFRSFPRCQQKQKSDWRIWELIYQALINAIYFFCAGFIFLQRKLGQKLVSGNKNTGMTYQKKTGMMCQIDIRRCVEHVKHLRLWQLDRANTGWPIWDVITRRGLAKKLWFLKRFWQISCCVRNRPPKFPQGHPLNPKSTNRFLYGHDFSIPKVHAHKLVTAGWHAQMTICWTFQA